RRHHRRGGWRDPQSVDLVRAAHRVPRNLAGAIVRAVVRYAGFIERRFSGISFGNRGGDRDLPFQRGHADGAGRLVRRGRAVAAGGGDLKHTHTVVFARLDGAIKYSVAENVERCSIVGDSRSSARRSAGTTLLLKAKPQSAPRPEDHRRPEIR